MQFTENHLDSLAGDADLGRGEADFDGDLERDRSFDLLENILKAKKSELKFFITPKYLKEYN